MLFIISRIEEKLQNIWNLLVSPRKANIDIGIETSFQSTENHHSIAHQNGHNSTLDLYQDDDDEDEEGGVEMRQNEKPEVENTKNENNFTPKAENLKESMKFQEHPPKVAPRQSLFYSEEESITMDEDKITVSRDELTSPEHDLDDCRNSKIS